MPYVRRHGNQISIVHGERDKTSGSVVQRSLFTLYSKAEAKAALGESGSEHSLYFERLLSNANPQITFNWKKVREEIKELLPALPDIYPVQTARLEEGLEPAIHELAKRVATASPTYLRAAQAALKKHEQDLSTLAQLIEIRLAEMKKIGPRDLTAEKSDIFLWRYEAEKNRIPLDIEEFTANLYEQGHYDQLRSICSLLTKSFPEWAEGHNRLGLVALKEHHPKEAVEHFKEAAKQGRGYFARRIPKSDYWLDFSTRPYIRALQNLSLSLNMAGQWREALETCDQLEKECGDACSASVFAHRASAYLNLLEWENAAQAALTIAQIAPDEGFITSFALFELGRHLEAIQWFLYAALNSPRVAYLLVGQKDTKPKTGIEIEEHNAGVEMYRSLPRFFRTQSKASIKFFKKLVEDSTFSDLLTEVRQRQYNHYDHTGDKTRRENLIRWNELRELKFAKAHGKEIAKKLGIPAASKLKSPPLRLGGAD